MADYSTIKGFTIQSLASDPYATSIASATWASGGEINQARTSASGFGNPAATTAMIAGGWVSPGVGRTLNTESYNGSAWTEVNNLTGSPAISGAGSTGTATAGLFFGGDPTTPGANVAITQEYDGTSWATSGSMNTARRDLSSGGTQTAAFGALGAIDPPFSTAAETYNGSTWTSVNSCNTARRSSTGSGTTTAGLAYGGYIGPSTSANTESYDGTSWTEVSDLNTARNNGGGTHSGTNTAALMSGGDTPPATAVVEYFDGSTWTEVADLAGVRVTSAGSGTSTDAFVAGGSPAPPSASYKNTTEFFTPASPLSLAQEGQVWYNSTSNVLKSFGQQGTGVWASAPSLNTSRSAGGSAGDSVSAALYNGGDPTPGVITETYDGSAWTEVGNSSNTRSEYGNSWNGTATACIVARGAPGPIISAAESWNGTSWSALTAVPTAARGSMGAGTSTAAVVAGGYSPSNVAVATCFEYNAPSWSTGNALNTARVWFPGGGSQTAAIAAGGTGLTANVEKYDGTSWTETANLNTAREGAGMAGGQSAQTSAIIFGGKVPSQSALTEQWNGTSWTETGDLANARGVVGGSGPSSMAALAFGGGSPPNPPTGTLTEEFSVPNATKTFTAS